jgi:hypothetical protein
MKKTKISLAIILSVALFSISATGAFASGYGQDSTCTGAYGQNTDCDSVDTDKDSSEVVYTEVELADTALDTPTLLVAMATMTSGAGAFFLKKKIA